MKLIFCCGRQSLIAGECENKWTRGATTKDEKIANCD